MRYESLLMIHSLWILIWDQLNFRLAKQKCLIFSSLWLTWTRSRTGTTSITTRPFGCGTVTFVIWTTRPWLTGWWCTSRTWMWICMFFILLKLSKMWLFDAERLNEVLILSCKTIWSRNFSMSIKNRDWFRHVRNCFWFIPWNTRQNLKMNKLTTSCLQMEETTPDTPMYQLYQEKSNISRFRNRGKLGKLFRPEGCLKTICLHCRLCQ